MLLLVGAAMTTARTLRAQQKGMPLVGFLSISRLPQTWATWAAAASFKDCAKPASSRDKIYRSNAAGPKAIMIGCPLWPPTWSAARSI